MMLFASAPEFSAVLLAAVALDRVIGDPPSWPHPVRLIGGLLTFLEPRARRQIKNPFCAGTVAAIFALLAVSAAVTALLALPGFLHLIASAYLAFSGLALGQLIREGEHAAALLRAGDIPGARIAVGRLVSRDVSNAGHDELSRVLAETLSENLNDAFTAPLFWFAVGGPLGLWLYKTVSTLDSMWGYPHEPWTRFGTFAARLDDILAFIPARITVFLLAAQTGRVFSAASGAIRSRLARPRPRPSLFWPGYATIRNDARKMKSPNAGWPMTAAAWIFRGTMGGPAVYAGKIVDKPILGPPGEPWTAEKLSALIQALGVSGVFWTLAALFCGAAIRWQHAV